MKYLEQIEQKMVYFHRVYVYSNKVRKKTEISHLQILEKLTKPYLPLSLSN